MEKKNVNEEIVEVKEGEEEFNELIKGLEDKFIDDSEENIVIESDYDNKNKTGIIYVCSYEDSNTSPRITKRIKADFNNGIEDKFIFYKYGYDKIVKLEEEVKKGIERIRK